jgi:cytochrome c556
MNHSRSRVSSGFARAVVAVGAVLTVGVLAGGQAAAQPTGGSARTAPAVASGAKAAPKVVDIVMARRNVMAAIGRNMDGITGMVEPGGKLEPADASEHADEIAVLLLAFPYLFPEGSNNYSKAANERDPAHITQASPAVWAQPAAFESMAKAASQQATDASRSHDEAQFRVRAAALEATCAACHAQFRREEQPYSIPIAPLAKAKP